MLFSNFMHRKTRPSVFRKSGDRAQSISTIKTTPIAIGTGLMLLKFMASRLRDYKVDFATTVR